MAVDEDHMAVDEQLEQDGTQEKQQQQKNEEEECEDSEEEEEVVVFEEDEDVDDIYMLLKPFTKKQLYDLSKHAIKNHGDVVDNACRKVARYCGHVRPPLDPQIYQKEEFLRKMEDCEMLLNCVDWRKGPLDELLESFWALELEGFVRICVNKLPVFADYVRDLADRNPAHKTILVRSHGFGWDATPESLTSEFAIYGDIVDIFYNNHHVTDDHNPKINCCASILFKRWRSACDALLQQPVVNTIGVQLTVVKKIGNRTTVCTLAPFGEHFCRCLVNNRLQDPSQEEGIAAPPNQARLVPVQVRPDRRWIPWEHSLHGSLAHFLLQMDRVGKMEEKPAMSTHHNNSTHKYLLLNHSSLLCLLLNEKFETRDPVAFPPHLFPKNITFGIMGSSSANGILGLWFLKNNAAVLWNPFTKEIKIVPPSLVEFESPYQKPDILYHGFGYDSGEDDYKLIRYVYFCESDSCTYSMENVSILPLWEIYSLKSDSWKKLGCKMPPRYLDRNCAELCRLCTGRVCHWLGERNKSLVSFDLSKEDFSKTDTPSKVWRDEGERLLGEINGHVALIASYGAQTKTTIEVSTLNKLGEEGSWTKLFIVGPLPCVVNHLIGVGKGGDIFFYDDDDGVAWFDVSTCQIVHLGLKQSCQIVTYKDNLESLISRGFEKYDDEDIVNVGQITKVYESERGKCRKVQKEDSAAML